MMLRRIYRSMLCFGVFLAACNGHSTIDSTRYEGEAPDPYTGDGIYVHFLAPEIPPVGGRASLVVYEGGTWYRPGDTDKVAQIGFSIRVNTGLHVGVMAMLTEAQLLPLLKGDRVEVNQSLDYYPSFYGQLESINDWANRIYRTIDALQIKKNDDDSLDVDIWMGTPLDRSGERERVRDDLAPNIIATIRGDVDFACVTKDELPDPTFSSEFCAGMIAAGAGELFGIEP